MSESPSTTIDASLNLRFNDLDPQVFERFFLHFLNSGVALTVSHHGQEVTRKVISATTYAAGSGRKQFGIDLRAEMEGGEIWVFQCKRVKTWSVQNTRKAIEMAHQYRAHHYFLVVACDPQQPVYDEITKHGNWTLWNNDRISSEFRLRVPAHKQRDCLFFLSPDELKKFVPFSTRALIEPKRFFERFLDSENTFRHNWALVGREAQLKHLYDFLSAPEQVLVVTAKGGDGKSRLMWEFCRGFHDRFPDGSAFFLNPQHCLDNPEFAFIAPAKPTVIIVDDAHRTENLPISLLNLIRESGAKLVLATRPQGVGPLHLKLFEAGLQDRVAALSLLPLTFADVLALARQALRGASEDQIETLAQQTKDSPFLTVIAGDLIHRGKLKWPGDLGAEEFRREIFRAFEEENLRHVSDDERPRWRNLVRLIALLAPVEDPVGFAEKAAGCLAVSVVDIEDRLSRLRATEQVVGHPNKLRVVPDLFADFLVYDACFEPSAAKPAFVRQVVRVFIDQSPAMLRNLAEAAWIARRNGVADAQFLDTLLTAEYRRFEAASFFRRAEIVGHWTSFAVFLPAESLELARRALALQTAASEPEREFSLLPKTHLDTRSHVLQRLPQLLKPVAIYHDTHRRNALNLLWELGLALDWKAQANNQNHPWAVIAEVMRIEPDKPVSITNSALDWFAEKVRLPQVLSVLEDPEPVLQTLLAPCFSHLLESRWAEGRTIHVRTAVVPLSLAQPIRDRALAVIGFVLEHGSWLAALDGLSALEAGYRRIAKHYEEKVKDLARFRLEWRPERLKALELLKMTLTRHGHVAIRFAVRRSLKGLVTHEEDLVVKNEAREILKGIREDIDLKTSLVLLCHGLYDYDEEAFKLPVNGDYVQQQVQWQRRVVEIAQDLAVRHTTAQKLFKHLDSIVSDLVLAGESPNCRFLYAGLVQIDPRLAIDLAGEILVADSREHLVSLWPLLVADNPATDLQQRLAVFEAVADGSNPGAKDSLVEHISWRLASKDHPLSDDEKALAEKLASNADTRLALRFLQLVRRADGTNRDWAWSLLCRLPLREVAKRTPAQLAEVFDIHCGGTELPSGNVVRLVLKHLVEAPRLNFSYGRETWSRLKREYAKEIYDLVVARIHHQITGIGPDAYDPIPDEEPGSFDLPELQTHPGYATICDELWRRVTDLSEPKRYYWNELFRAVVIQNASNWLALLIERVPISRSSEELDLLVSLIKFKGSMVIFRQPEFARLVLKTAERIGGPDLKTIFRSHLYFASGPQVRGYSNGKLDREYDYIEAAASKAAAEYSEDPVLGPFYRWIVQVEQRDRMEHQARFEAELM